MVIIINGNDKDTTITKRIGKADIFIVGTEADVPEEQPKDVIFAVKEISE